MNKYYIRNATVYSEDSVPTFSVGFFIPPPP